MQPYYRPSEEEDVLRLAPKVRQQDVRELQAAAGYEPLLALHLSYTSSDESHTIIAPDGEVVGMFGVCPTNDPLLGVPWLLASDRLPEVSREFIPQSLDWVNQVNSKYPVLCNYVDKRNTVAIRWLKWLGFEFVRLIEDYGYEQKPFYEFVRIDNV